MEGYISACESTWRILSFPTKYRSTPVTKLSFHLPGQQFLVYNEDDPMDEVISNYTISQSKFLDWMEANRKYPEARELTYADFPTKFFWVLKTKEWQTRDIGFAIGRITYVPLLISKPII